MPNVLVKIIRDDDGFLIDNPVWHLVDPANLLGKATLCTGEFFGSGESAVEFETKTVSRGGVECESCRQKILTYKLVKL